MVVHRLKRRRLEPGGRGDLERMLSVAMIGPKPPSEQFVVDAQPARPDRTQPRVRLLSRRPAGLPTTRRSALAARPREPSFDDGPRQRGMSHAVLGCKRTERQQVLLVETHRDLFCAWGANGNVEIFEMLCEFLDAVARPEVTLLLVAAEAWNLTLPCRYRTH